MITSEKLNERGAGKLPGHLGIVISAVGETVTAMRKTIALFRCTQLLIYPK